MSSRKRRYLTSFTQREMYNDYKKHRKLNSKVTRDNFSKIVFKFNREIIKLILYHNFQFKIPHGLGMLSIMKVKKHGYILDDNGEVISIDLVKDRLRTWDLWQNDPKAREEKRYIYFLNEHTDGYVYRYAWTKKGVNIPNYRSYSFSPTRSNKKWLYEVLTDDNLDVDYFEIKNTINNV